MCVLCACRGQERMSDGLFHHSPPYPLETESLTEASARLAACKPEQSSCLCLSQVTGTGVAVTSFLHWCWDLSAGPNVCAASVEPGVCVSGFCGWHWALYSLVSSQLQEVCMAPSESILGRTLCSHCISRMASVVCQHPLSSGKISLICQWETDQTVTHYL